MLVSAVGSSDNGWFMDLGVAAIDLKFFDPGCFFKLRNIKGLHFNEYNTMVANLNH